ncbi:MAG TPA: glycosyltransferase, partial [Armatimonadota bacterium]|nr:glycosyltransferase [Armatimonadota bacterium]
MNAAPPSASRALTPLLEGAARRARVLILSAKFGGGHKSTAEALRYWWEANVPENGLRVVDYFDEFVSPVMTQAATIGYTQSVRLFPLGYKLFYEVTQDLTPESATQQWLNNLGKRGLEAFLEESPQDIIVAVHPTPAGALSDLRMAGRLESLAVTIVTDYAVHSQWIHPGTDLYLVGSDCVRDGLVRRGVPEEKIRVTGIPIRANTGLLAQREALKEKWGLKPGLPTVLVMTGAQGMLRRPGALFHTIASRPVQGFFLCGKDKALMARLRLWAERYPLFRIMGFVRVVPELMCVSDILISKAGGLTTSEALAMELPMIIFHPIPGQEYANRDYLVRSGAAIAADSRRELGA